MKYDDMLNFVLKLPFDTMTEVYNNSEQSILIFRPSTLPKRFKDYDVNKNFQIFLKIRDEKPFRPNHLRLLIDLKLRARELPQYKEKLLVAFDKIFYGDEPLDAIQSLDNIHFTQYINPIDITAVLAQLFIIEQNIGYGNKSILTRQLSIFMDGYEPLLLPTKKLIRLYIEFAETHHLLLNTLVMIIKTIRSTILMQNYYGTSISYLASCQSIMAACHIFLFSTKNIWLFAAYHTLFQIYLYPIFLHKLKCPTTPV